MAIASGWLVLAAPLTQVCKAVEGAIKKPTQPGALAATVLSDPVHTVIPIPSAHQGQVVHPRSHPFNQRTAAMLEQGISCAGFRVMPIAFVLPRFQQGRMAEGDLLAQDRNLRR